jgi:drug/metabolite transporter (DMT)-like permease
MRNEHIFRFKIAWIVGAATYFVGAVFTTMDGMPSFIMQPIMAAIVSAIAVVVCREAGHMLRVPFLRKVWTETKWLPALIAGIGIALLVFSAFPGQMTLHTRVVDDEFRESWKTLGDSCFPGYFALLFAVANWPLGTRSESSESNLRE